MTRRQAEGSEAYQRLKNWDRGQKASERLSAHIAQVEGYKSIDPSHPLGGKDGLKDIICFKNGKKWVGASYFSIKQQPISKIKSKFTDDLKGVKINDANGFIFVTNQKLTIGDRKELNKFANNIETDLFHLERITLTLNSPECYGIRLEYLDIEMDKEEQLAFIATRDKLISGLHDKLDTIVAYINKSEVLRKEFDKIKRIDVPIQIYEKITEKFNYDDGPGWYRHKKTNTPFCYDCLQNGVVRPLIKAEGAYWQCPVCNKHYYSFLRMMTHGLRALALAGHGRPQITHNGDNDKDKTAS
ncbi:hypothetical protein QUF75_14570 [Desulfococcaceae bacterium HSG7]|nr:hypothetical protein [Desulfococcaceae bacterium HSG7]